MKKKNIVVIGGGTGTYTALTGLKRYAVYPSSKSKRKEGVHLAAVVAMADNGGSTKVLREEFGVLPPGCVRPALVALSNAEKSLSDLFNYRFEEGNGHKGLGGHNFGNLFITALTKELGSFEEAIERAGKILNIRGEVIPSTLDDCNLRAKLENGKVIKGEENIDEPKHDGKLSVEKVWLDPKCKANPKALQAIKRADLIVIGPGDLYTSILPNFLVGSIARAVKKSKAKKVYVCNLMTKFGETNDFGVKEFVEKLQEYIGKDVLDYVLVNTKKPNAARVGKYEEEHAQVVKYDKKDFKDASFKVIQRNLLRPQGFIRHDSGKLARVLMSLLP